MSQLLRQATGSTDKVPKSTGGGTYTSLVAKLRDKLTYLSGTTPRLQSNSTTPTAKILHGFLQGFLVQIRF